LPKARAFSDEVSQRYKEVQNVAVDRRHCMLKSISVLPSGERLEVKAFLEVDLGNFIKIVIIFR
jgi:hypothetical protein